MDKELKKIIEKYKNKNLVVLVLFDYSPLSKKLIKEMEKIKSMELFFEYYDKEEPQVIFLKKGKILEVIKGLIPKEVVKEKLKFFNLNQEKLVKKLLKN
jgi:hypothetical protein